MPYKVYTYFIQSVVHIVSILKGLAPILALLGKSVILCQVETTSI